MNGQALERQPANLFQVRDRTDAVPMQVQDAQARERLQRISQVRDGIAAQIQPEKLRFVLYKHFEDVR